MCCGSNIVVGGLMILEINFGGITITCNPAVGGIMKFGHKIFGGIGI